MKRELFHNKNCFFSLMFITNFVKSDFDSKWFRFFLNESILNVENGG